MIALNFIAFWTFVFLTLFALGFSIATLVE